MNKKLIFFGRNCSTNGHFLYENDGYSLRDGDAERIMDMPGCRLFGFLDGLFCPYDTTEQGRYKVNSVPPLLIVSWWDYTGDSRPGSNSNLIGRGFESGEEMIKAAFNQFPKIMGRQKKLEPLN